MEKESCCKGAFIMNKTEILKKTFLFDSLTPHEIQTIAERCELKPFKQNEMICRQGERHDRLNIIGAGQVRVSIVGSDGTERSLSFLSSGNSFGEMSLLTGEPASANVAAVIDTEIYSIGKEDFQQMIDRYPSIPLKINVLLSQRLKEMNLNLDLKRLERGLTLLVAFEEWLEPLAQSAAVLGETLASQFKKNVLVLLFLPSAAKDKIGNWIKGPLAAAGENQAFTFYRAGERLHFGFLKPGAEGPVAEKGARFLSEFFSQYDQVLAAVSYKDGFDKNNFLSQARKAIYFFPGKEVVGNPKLLSLTVPKNAQRAVALFKDEMPIEIASSQIRNHFQGPLFVFPAAESPNFLSSGIIQAARFILNKSIGIVLGGGGARGFAHIGVLRALEKHHLLPDAYCGSSMGGIVASFYAMGLTTDEAIPIISYHAKKKRNKFDFHFPYRSIIKGKKLEKMALEVYGEKTIEELLHPLYLVCADLVSGDEVVLGKGLLRTAVYASADLPGVMPPVRMGNQYLVDGSLLNKVPVSVLKERGIQHVIAVNVTPRVDPSFFKSTPNILNIISRSFDLVNYKLSYAEISPLDILIEPNLANFDFFGFKDVEGIVRGGEEAIESAMEKIKQIAYA